MSWPWQFGKQHLLHSHQESQPFAVQAAHTASQHLAVLVLKIVLPYLSEISPIAFEDRLEPEYVGHHSLSTDKPPVAGQADPIGQFFASCLYGNFEITA